MPVPNTVCISVYCQVKSKGYNVYVVGMLWLQWPWLASGQASPLHDIPPRYISICDVSRNLHFTLGFQRVICIRRRYFMCMYQLVLILNNSWLAYMGQGGVSRALVSFFYYHHPPLPRALPSIAQSTRDLQWLFLFPQSFSFLFLDVKARKENGTVVGYTVLTSESYGLHSN